MTVDQSYCLRDADFKPLLWKVMIFPVSAGARGVCSEASRCISTLHLKEGASFHWERDYGRRSSIKEWQGDGVGLELGHTVTATLHSALFLLEQHWIQTLTHTYSLRSLEAWEAQQCSAVVNCELRGSGALELWSGSQNHKDTEPQSQKGGCFSEQSEVYWESLYSWQECGHQ